MRQDLEEEVLQRISPSLSEREDIHNVAKELLDLLSSQADGRYEPLLVGSVPKGTFLKDPDIDVFLLFNPEIPKDVMANTALGLGRKVLDEPVEKYAEHPYINGIFKGYNADIVPCYRVDDIGSMLSSVDRTPLHTEYIIKNLAPHKKDDVMLLKAFLKGIGAYGAHAQVKGFSGYLCELMVLHYGDFQDVLKAVNDWVYGQKVEIVESEKDFKEPLVFIDPVDPSRNVASAVDEETLALFVYASKSYLLSPSISFFFPGQRKKRSGGELKDFLAHRRTQIILLSFPRPDIIDENLFPQVEKASRKLHEHLELHDFKVIHSGGYVRDNIFILFDLEQVELPNIKKHTGPPVFHDNARRFELKYGDEVYIEGSRLMTDKVREHTEVFDLIRHLIEELDLGSDINSFMRSSLDIYLGDEAVDCAADVVDEFFYRRFPWK